MTFRKFVIKRVVGAIFAYAVIATILFFLFRAVGDPSAVYAGSGDFTAEEIRRIEELFGMHEPVHIQYLYYLRNAFTLDLGLSYFYYSPVRPLVIERLINSLLITVPAIILAYLIGVTGGVLLAWRRGEPVEEAGLVVGIVFRSSPEFWIGLIFLFLFSSLLPIFPAGGILPPGTSYDTVLDIVTHPDFYRHIVGPVVSLAIYLTGLPLLLMRTSMLEVLEEDFVDLCRAKGMPERRVMYRHVARNALLPVITALTIAIGFAFGGNVLIETVFSYPGVGRLMVRSILDGDYPMAQAAFLIMAAMVLLMNLIADIAYGVLDPRVTYE